jgi:hypothetical protein
MQVARAPWRPDRLKSGTMPAGEFANSFRSPAGAGPGTMLATLLGWQVTGLDRSSRRVARAFPAVLAFVLSCLTCVERPSGKSLSPHNVRGAFTGCTGLIIAGVVSLLRLFEAVLLSAWLAFGAGTYSCCFHACRRSS